MHTFDVVLHTNGGMFRDNAQQLMASFPPVKERVELGFGCWMGKLDGDLAKVLMDTCDPTLLGVPKPVRLDAQFYAYVRELDDSVKLIQWDIDSRLQRCVAMSRLINPTAVGFRYVARIQHGPSLDSLKIVPADIHGISLDVFLSPNHERDWLTIDEAQHLAKVIAASETLQQPAFPARVSRALWYFDSSTTHNVPTTRIYDGRSLRRRWKHSSVQERMTVHDTSNTGFQHSQARSEPEH